VSVPPSRGFHDTYYDITNESLGKKWTVYSLKPEDLEKGKFLSPWIPSYTPNLPPETVRDSVITFISCWALGIYKGIADVSPVWNEGFPDIKYQTVEEMLHGAWARLQARK
jgi:hypothetical protein